MAAREVLPAGTVLDASYRIAGSAKPRSVKARAFYKGTYETALKAGEIVTAIEVPAAPKQAYAYEKLKRKVRTA